MFTSERIFVKSQQKGESSQESLNVSFSSNNSFYSQLNNETKRDIIYLIKSGYNKRTIIKLYLLLKPSNINEAVNYLTKENGINQHIFYESLNQEDTCEICGEKKIMHINENDRTMNISFNTIYTTRRNENVNIIRIKTEEEKNYICKICYENICDEEKINNKCEQCGNYFCNECLYLHIKELIKNGNYALFCPECKNIYTKNKIEQIFLLSKDKELNNLKKLLEKNNTKEIILSNPGLMFCPIVNCDGFAKKNDEKDYNICNMGHKFCNKCGEKWHENGRCKEEENIDKLFEEYSKQYNLKNCPYCHIVVIKKGGCNHMNCKYCGKNWCWLCNEIFDSIEEHYGNINSKCYNKMINDNNNENNQIVLCSKCDTEINDNNFITFRCDHIICNNCYVQYLFANCVMIIFPANIIYCSIIGCNDIRVIKGDQLIEIINNSNNEKLIKKYKKSILLYEYAIKPIFVLISYLDILFFFYKLIGKLFNCCSQYKFYFLLEIIGIFFGIIIIPVYVLIIPIFPLFVIKRIYYLKFLPEIRQQYNNKLITLSIFLAEEILSLILIFSLFCIHYIFLFICLPIFGLILLIRKFYYGLTCG